MSKPLGSSNKNPPAAPDTVNLTTEERIEFLADLIADRIIADQADGQVLFREIGGAYDS